jgi:hypothetical protein
MSRLANFFKGRDRALRWRHREEESVDLRAMGSIYIDSGFDVVAGNAPLESFLNREYPCHRQKQFVSSTEENLRTCRSVTDIGYSLAYWFCG